MRRALCVPVFVLTFLLTGIAPVAPAQAQVRRCATASGNVVYTDRQCDDIGASPVLAPISPVGAGNGGNALRSMCARSVRDLAYGLESALQSGDVNRIASIYDWTGVANATAERLMDRFDAMAARGFVDVQPVYAAARMETDPDPSAAAVADPAQPPPAPGPQRLVGLRVEQVLSNGRTPSHTVFGIVQRMGCWWIRG